MCSICQAIEQLNKDDQLKEAGEAKRKALVYLIIAKEERKVMMKEMDNLKAGTYKDSIEVIRSHGGIVVFPPKDH